MDLGDRVSKQGKKLSPEERLGSTLHKDLPEIIPQELRDRSIPADNLNPHFAGANMRLWRRDDLLVLLQLIEGYNSRFHNGYHWDRGSLLIDQIWQLQIIDSLARVTSKCSLDAGAMGDERDEVARDWLQNLEQHDSDILYCLTYYYDVIDKSNNGKSGIGCWLISMAIAILALIRMAELLAM